MSSEAERELTEALQNVCNSNSPCIYTRGVYSFLIIAHTTNLFVVDTHFVLCFPYPVYSQFGGNGEAAAGRLQALVSKCGHVAHKKSARHEAAYFGWS